MLGVLVYELMLPAVQRGVYEQALEGEGGYCGSYYRARGSREGRSLRESARVP